MSTGGRSTLCFRLLQRRWEVPPEDGERQIDDVSFQIQSTESPIAAVLAEH